MLDQFTVQGFDTQEFWIFFSLATGFASFGLFKGLKAIARARLIENTPTSKIRSAPQGYVELVGTCQPSFSGVVLAPLSKTPCVWFRYKVEKKNDKNWSTVKSGMSNQPILFNDGTDTCAIFTKGIHASIDNKTTWYGSTPLVTGISPVFFGGGRFRYTEELLLEGNDIYCLGNFITLDQPLDDGRAENPVIRKKSEENSHDIRHTLSQPKNGTPFLLSNRPQSRLVSRIRRGGWFGVFVFFVGGAIAIRLLFSRFIA